MICLVILAIVIFPQTSYAWVDFGCRTAIFDLNCGIGELLYNLAAAFAFICGNILDLVVRFFVFEMTTTLETGNLFALQEGDIPTYRFVWFIVRDLANLSFIFILIYAALATIFQIQSVNIRRVIPQLILVAILMNFSLFFVQVATDFSNYLSYQFFTAVEINVAPDTDDGSPVGLGSTGSTTAQIGQSQQQGLSNIIMNVTRITALIGTPEAGSVDNLASSGSAQNPGIAFGVFASIFTIIGALVMLAGAMLLFIRFFMIVIYMIASPIAFAASITQGGKDKITKNWWLKGLTAQLAFAPAYFGVLYLSLIFLSAMTGEGAFNPSGNDGILAYWVRNAMIFIVSSAFLIFALIASKRIGAVGGNFALRMTKQGAGAIIGGGSAWAMRKTLGAGASRLSSGDRERYLQNKIAKGGVSGQVARMQLKTLKGVANQGFDLRSTAKYIPGVSTDDLRFQAEGEIGRGYNKRRDEDAEKRKKEADETRKFLDDDAKAYFNARLDTKKDGVLGVIQGLAFKRDRDGTATPRAITKGVLDGVKGIQSKIAEKFPSLKEADEALARERDEKERKKWEILYPKVSQQKRESLEESIQRDVSLLVNERANDEEKRKNITDNIARVEAAHDQKELDRLRSLDKRTRLEEKKMDALASQESYLTSQKAELENLGKTASMLEARIEQKNLRLASMNKPQVMFERKTSELEEKYKQRLTDAFEHNGGMLGVKQEIDLIASEESFIGDDSKKKKIEDDFEQHMKDQVGDERFEAWQQERKTITSNAADANRKLQNVENAFLKTSKDLRRIVSDLEDIKTLEAKGSRRTEKETERLEKLLSQQVELEAEEGRLRRLKERQDEELQRQQVETNKELKKAMESLSRIDSTQVNLMEKNVYVRGSYANQQAAMAGFKQLQNARKKNKTNIDYDAFARAVERGVDDSNIGGDRDRDEGDISSS